MSFGTGAHATPSSENEGTPAGPAAKTSSSGWGKVWRVVPSENRVTVTRTTRLPMPNVPPIDGSSATLTRTGSVNVSTVQFTVVSPVLDSTEPALPGTAMSGSAGTRVKWAVTCWAGLNPSSIVAVSV